MDKFSLIIFTILIAVILLTTIFCGEGLCMIVM